MMKSKLFGILGAWLLDEPLTWSLLFGGAMVLFGRGHWKAAIGLHAFAPLFLGACIFLVVSSILPSRLQQKIADQIAALERLSGIVGLLMLSILAYWILRIINLI